MVKVAEDSAHGDGEGTKGTGVSWEHGNDRRSVDPAEKPDPKLIELSELLVGTWQVTGPGIAGQAEFQSRREGCLLVADVDFTDCDSKMKVIQHISNHQGRDTLRAQYMDTMGDVATYTWVLDHGEIRVSLGDADSDSYFEATLNKDNSEYIGTWHYPGVGLPDSVEKIVYTRVEYND